MNLSLTTDYMQYKEKCNKCDERGYIPTGKYSSKSCECGWAIEQQELKIREIFPTIADLLDYAQKRIGEKNIMAKTLGSIKSEKKAKSSRENGKKGGRPKKQNAIN